jgi:guanylate kinase
VQSAQKVKKVRTDAIFIFLAPPTKEELKRRLEKRGTESKDEINKRFGVATRELKELNKIFRFGHLGYCSEFDLVSGLAALEQVLAKLNYKFELGAGLKAFQQAIQKTSMTKVKV